MEGEPSAQDGPNGDDRTLCYRAQFDAAGPRSLLRVVSDGLADLLGTAPESLEPPLATVAAWDALERLLEQQATDDTLVHYVEFAYEGYVVAVHGDGRVRIFDVEE